MHTRTRLENTRLGSLATQIRKRHHKAHRLAKATLHAEHLTAIERSNAVTNQVERHTLTGQRPLRVAMHLDPAYAAGRARRQRDELIAHRNRRIVQRSRHDGAGALDRKAAVDGQTRCGIGELGTGSAGTPASGNLLVERSQQVIDSRTGLRRHRHNRRVGKHGTRQKVIDVELGKLGHLGVGQVAHRQRDHHVCDAQQLQHMHVLAGLRHHALDGRNHQHGDVDTRGTLHHGAQVMRVARHVDQANDLAARQRQLAKAQLNGHAATALNLQTVGVFTRQRLDERRLTVVDAVPTITGHSTSAWTSLIVQPPSQRTRRASMPPSRYRGRPRVCAHQTKCGRARRA